MFIEMQNVVCGGGNVYHSTITLNSTGQGTVTDCPFSPDTVITKYQNGNDWAVSLGGNTTPMASIAYQGGSMYSYNNYGITVSGNTININTGLAITFSKTCEIIAMKD